MFLYFSTLVYVEMGQGSTDTATLAFTFSTTSTVRTWEIKATQIPCGASYRPPDGCLQYHTTLTGRFQTFNFAETTTASQAHLLAQKYFFLILHIIPARTLFISGVKSRVLNLPFFT